MSKVGLRFKILFGYFIILAVISSVIIIISNEKQQLHNIEMDSESSCDIRHDIYAAHRYITELATLGEAVIIGEEADYLIYHERRLCTDSLLQKLKPYCREFIHPDQIDTLCSLLAGKEQHLHYIMQTFHNQEKADSLFIHRLPTVARNMGGPHKITRKKKGIAGLLGKKETIETTTPAITLYALDEKMIEMQEKQRLELGKYTAILRTENRKLNNELVKLISKIDILVQTALRQKEERIAAMRQRSFRAMTYVLVVAVILLLISYLIIQRDLRQKAKSHRALKESIGQNRALLEMRKKIILTISHDIRGPLGSIIGSAELAMDTREKKKRNHHLLNIQNSCRHILHLVNNLLDIYRLNEWKETRNDVLFKPKEFIEHIVARYSVSCNDKGLMFNTEMSGLEVTLIGDVDRIEQILDNLLVNAIKFTEAGEIRLVVIYKYGNLILDVMDTGIGMSKETLSRIFEPFERAAQEVNAEGFGLGLSITRGLVGLLGGEISVESIVGTGSKFHVVLPLVQAEGHEENENRINTKIIAGVMRLPEQVLIIDDDTVQLAVIKEMLERNGVICYTCSHVKVLVQKLRQQNFDLILTDIQMPGTNGFELLKLLRSADIGNSRTIPIMAMTARGDTGTYDFTEAGFAGCISKPFSSQELLSSISSIFLQNEIEEIVDFKQLTYEVDDKRLILELFVNEAQKSITEFQDALKTLDRKFLRDTLHRIYPVWELLKIERPLDVYHKMLHDETVEEDTIRQETDKIISYMQKLVTKARREIDDYGTAYINS